MPGLIRGRTGIRRTRRPCVLIIDIDTFTVHIFEKARLHARHLVNVSTVGSGQCCICLDEGEMRLFDCGHTMHTECALQWFETSCTCPTCRSQIHL